MSSVSTWTKSGTVTLSSRTLPCKPTLDSSSVHVPLFSSFLTGTGKILFFLPALLTIALSCPLFSPSNSLSPCDFASHRLPSSPSTSSSSSLVFPPCEFPRSPGANSHFTGKSRTGRCSVLASSSLTPAWLKVACGGLSAAARCCLTVSFLIVLSFSTPVAISESGFDALLAMGCISSRLKRLPRASAIQLETLPELGYGTGWHS
ncbi:hypothetical protein ANANG_G00162340, partial [Anguilla anguilla]